MGPMLGLIVGGLKMNFFLIRMFQYIKRNILRGGDSPNNDFGFLADQLLYNGLFYVGAWIELWWHLAYKLELIAEILIFIVRDNVKQRPQVILGWSLFGFITWRVELGWKKCNHGSHWKLSSIHLLVSGSRELSEWGGGGFHLTKELVMAPTTKLN